MMSKGDCFQRSRVGLFCGASLAAITLITATSTSAQEAAPPSTASQPSESQSLSEIVVTGTRVVRDGFKAPTPTSVIGAEEIAARSPANIADYLNQLPSLAGSATPRSTGSFVGGGLIGINALNLRSLNPNRTLVLLDGQRVGASSLTGLVDVNQFPQQLVKRVDVVTGGASSSWGSDAVAGVVNFVLDHEFTGLKAQVQGGVTDYGDDRNWNLQLSAGSKFAGGRGHILLSGELADSEGTNGIGKRKWYNGRKVLLNPAYTATNGQPQLLVRDNAGIATATPGGMILSGPLRGTYFGPGGTPGQFNFGSITSGTIQVGGDWQYSDYGTAINMAPELARQNVFGRVSYDLTDTIEVFAQASYSRATADQDATAYLKLGNLTIQPDNAFIPASIASRVTAPVTFGTLNADLGRVPIYNRRASERYVIGANGKLDAFGKAWTWEAYGQRSINRVYNSVLTLNTARYAEAIDAVRNASGQIVCRSTLTNPTNGCVPFNVFGTGVVSPTAATYVKGLSEGDNRLTQDVAAATLRGEPFSTWAGPVSVATGIEHRRERVTGSNDPLSTARGWDQGNYQASFGSLHVTEGFFETVVPLAKDLPFAKSFDFNGAVRATDYSTSGYVTTWKLGLTYAPTDDVSFRFTRSRDIRAPNLAELFQTGVGGRSTAPDPFRGNASTTFLTSQGGNTSLTPERADTLGFGVVLQPRFLAGFGASVDYYDIKIDDAITTVAPLTLLAQCFAGNTALCSGITRNSAGVITLITSTPVNLASQHARGLDFEASYRHELFGGNLTLRALATRYLKNYQSNGINLPTDNVGKNSADVALAAATGSGSTSLPKWRYMTSIGWDRDPVAFTFSARGFSDGVYSPAFVECTSACPTSTTDNMTIDNNQIPGAIYFDANVTIKLRDNIEAFLVVDNILNKDPVQIGIGPAISGAPLSVNQSLYDTLGRVFRVGARFKM
jgi:outer membrane receptor protein involved in Fe transport